MNGGMRTMSSNVKHTDYVIQDGSECEYRLTMPEHERIWLKLKGADIGIMHDDNGVSIDVYAETRDAKEFVEDCRKHVGTLVFRWEDE
jgi:beta-lactamase class D